MGKDFLKEIVNKYIEGKASKEEAEIFESFYDSTQQHGRKWEEFDLSNKEKTRVEIYKNIQSNIAKPKKSLITRLHPALKIAASVLILFSIGYLGHPLLKGNKQKKQPQLITITARYGEKKSIFLGDSSKITLNAGSEISFYKPFQKNKREVTLTGEAFFNVTKDEKRPFIVSTKNITTTVLGTSFNIYAYNDEDVNITVSTGKVKVTYTPPDGSIAKFAILFPGQQAVFNSGKNALTKHEVDIKQYIDWKNNKIYFEQDYFHEIITKLERNYNVDIRCNDPGLLQKTITSIYKNAEINEILDDLQFILGFEYSYLSNDTILISN